MIHLFSVRPDTSRPQLNLTVTAAPTKHRARRRGSGRAQWWRRVFVFDPTFGPTIASRQRKQTSTMSVSLTRMLSRELPRSVLGRGESDAQVHPDDGFRAPRHGCALPPSRRQRARRMESTARLACDAADQLSYIVTKYRSTNLFTDPCTRRGSGSRRRVSGRDSLYDSETELERHHFEYRATPLSPESGVDGALRTTASAACSRIIAPRTRHSGPRATTPAPLCSTKRPLRVFGRRWHPFREHGSFGLYVAREWRVVARRAGNNALVALAFARASVAASRAAVH